MRSDRLSARQSLPCREKRQKQEIFVGMGDEEKIRQRQNLTRIHKPQKEYLRCHKDSVAPRSNGTGSFKPFGQESKGPLKSQEVEEVLAVGDANFYVCPSHVGFVQFTYDIEIFWRIYKNGMQPYEGIDNKFI